MKYRDTEQRPLGTPLYYYTSIETMEKILRSKTMWASHISFMNDGSELEFGLDLFKQLLREAMQVSEGRSKDLAAALLANVDTQLIEYAPVFVLCFTEVPNLLSQWHMYTPHGRGVSIGFNHQAVVERSQREGWHWRACTYGRESQLAWGEAILTRLLRELAECPETMKPWDAVSAVLAKSGAEFYSVLASLKHPAFTAEREWRFVSPSIQLSDDRVKFRPSLTTLVPYVEFKLCDANCPELSIAETWIGPTTHANHAFAVVNAIQRQCRIPGQLTVRASQIPFRQI